MTKNIKPVKAWAVIDKDGEFVQHDIWPVLRVSRYEYPKSLDLHRPTDKIIPVLIKPISNRPKRSTITSTESLIKHYKALTP
jgi:hypothetical protein